MLVLTQVGHISSFHWHSASYPCTCCYRCIHLTQGTSQKGQLAQRQNLRRMTKLFCKHSSASLSFAPFQVHHPSQPKIRRCCGNQPDMSGSASVCELESKGRCKSVCDAVSWFTFHTRHEKGILPSKGIFCHTKLKHAQLPLLRRGTSVRATSANHASSKCDTKDIIRF